MGNAQKCLKCKFEIAMENIFCPGCGEKLTENNLPTPRTSKKISKNRSPKKYRPLMQPEINKNKEKKNHKSNDICLRCNSTNIELHTKDNEKDMHICKECKFTWLDS